MKLASPRAETGTAMLEAVMVLPVLLMLIFALIEFGILLARWQVLSNAAREGARRAVVYRDRTACSAAAVEAEVDAAVANYAATLGMSVGAGDVGLTGACVPGPATVTVSHVHDFLFIDRLAPSVLPSLRLVGRSSMRNE